MNNYKQRFKTVHQRFLERVGDKSDCWVWTGGVNTGGYGMFWTGNRNTLSHRYAYEKYVGKIPKGMLACHRCDNRRCVNPKHIFIGTHQDNTIDAFQKGRGNDLGAIHRNKPKCIKGHKLSGDNLSIRKKTGWRICRACRKDRQRKYYRGKYGECSRERND